MLMQITIETAIYFIIAWLIFTFAVWGGGALFQIERKWNYRGFGTSLVMALVVMLVIWLIWPLLPVEWALWVDLLIAFAILLICFAIFWDIGLLRALGASIVCLLLLWLILWIISYILSALSIPYIPLIG